MTAPRDISAPEPGWWAIRLVRGGPLVPASIRFEQTRFEPSAPENLMDRSPILTAYINGERVSPHDVWLRRGDPISREVYEFMLRDAAWCRENAPDDPKSRPQEAVDWSSVKITF